MPLGQTINRILESKQLERRDEQSQLMQLAQMKMRQNEQKIGRLHETLVRSKAYGQNLMKEYRTTLKEASIYFDIEEKFKDLPSLTDGAKSLIGTSLTKHAEKVDWYKKEIAKNRSNQRSISDEIMDLSNEMGKAKRSLLENVPKPGLTPSQRKTLFSIWDNALKTNDKPVMENLKTLYPEVVWPTKIKPSEGADKSTKYRDKQVANRITALEKKRNDPNIGWLEDYEKEHLEKLYEITARRDKGYAWKSEDWKLFKEFGEPESEIKVKEKDKAWYEELWEKITPSKTEEKPKVDY